jgi:hypothetical protein
MLTNNTFHCNVKEWLEIRDSLVDDTNTMDRSWNFSPFLFRAVVIGALTGMI